jgi:hypothetical protein
MAYEAKILADSICNGNRLTTMQLTHPRPAHSEFNTHCAFARNASSSRAIPFEKMLEKVLIDPYIPRTFGVNQKGMQAATYLLGLEYEKAKMLWLKARDNAVKVAKILADKDGLNIHKQVVNRILEPWGWITVCVTGDAGAWSNYFALRCHPDAWDAISDQAYMAQLAYFKSEPLTLSEGMWHTPYITYNDRIDNNDQFDERQISIGRCARTSYLTQEGKRDFQEDIKLFERLRDSTPMHASPFEHVCEAMGDGTRYAKYVGWRSYRHILPNEYVTDFKPNHPELV